jgi:hypothetical protein
MAGLGYMRKPTNVQTFYITTNTSIMDAEEINTRRGASATAELSFTDATFRDLMHLTDATGNVEVSFGDVHPMTKMTIGSLSIFGTLYQGYFTDPALTRYGSMQEDLYGSPQQGGWYIAGGEIPTRTDTLAEVGGNLRWVLKEGASGTDNISTDESNQLWTELRFYDDEDETTVIATKSYGSWNSSGKYWYWHSSIRPFGEASGNRYVELV